MDQADDTRDDTGFDIYCSSVSDQTHPVIISMCEGTTHSYFRSHLVSTSTADKSNNVALRTPIVPAARRGDWWVIGASPKNSSRQLSFSYQVGMINQIVELLQWLPGYEFYVKVKLICYTNTSRHNLRPTFRPLRISPLIVPYTL